MNPYYLNPLVLTIHRPSLHELNDCARLDASYVTRHTWQMAMDAGATDMQVTFQLITLPYEITVKDGPVQENLSQYWQRGDCLLAARENSVVTGYLHMIPDKNTHDGLIVRHVVDAAYRRQGIGSALLEHALRWARDRHLRSISVSVETKNYPAIAFYRAHGFSFCGFSEQPYVRQHILLHFTRGVH